MKRCTICKQQKEFNQFHNLKKSPDGKGTTCKLCMSKMKKESRDAKKAGEYDSNTYRKLVWKYCSCCGEYTNNFSLATGNPDGLTSWCRPCVNYGQIARQNGLTVEQYKAMVFNQPCAICKRVTSKLVLDHDHSCCPSGIAIRCGKCTRGAICNGCNLIVGHLENPDSRYSAALRYLGFSKNSI